MNNILTCVKRANKEASKELSTKSVKKTQIVISTATMKSVQSRGKSAYLEFKDRFPNCVEVKSPHLHIESLQIRQTFLRVIEDSLDDMTENIKANRQEEEKEDEESGIEEDGEEENERGQRGKEDGVGDEDGKEEGVGDEDGKEEGVGDEDEKEEDEENDKKRKYVFDDDDVEEEDERRYVFDQLNDVNNTDNIYNNTHINNNINMTFNNYYNLKKIYNNTLIETTKPCYLIDTFPYINIDKLDINLKDYKKKIIKNRLPYLIHSLERVPNKKTLIFCIDSDITKYIHYFLTDIFKYYIFDKNQYWIEMNKKKRIYIPIWKSPINIYEYSSNIANRGQVVENFKLDEQGILVCTDLAARGLNLNVYHVINFNLPHDTTTFLHRIGRASRLGHPGRVTNLWSQQEQEFVNTLISGTAFLKNDKSIEKQPFSCIFNKQPPIVI
eukprot:GHVL01011523.1.p1 GENE.GHVL01011523.1~~GHVL01011523.1.p1  ORF type:complete len:441 (-),score=127.16 GHVL01011523.1:48-1370(-)